jgi:AhpD family alkylhydroperoxidase
LLRYVSWPIATQTQEQRGNRVTDAAKTNYPARYAHINKAVGRLAQQIPGPISAFQALRKKAIEPGALSTSTKELIALGIAISVRCDGCIAFHVHDALQAGATAAEIEETIGVAMLMGGAPSLMYGTEAFEALEQFQAAEAA